MNNRYMLTEEVKQQFNSIINIFIETLEASEEGKEPTLDLSDTRLNPYTMRSFLVELGYRVVASEDNGRQMDFWIDLEKEGCKPLSISGCGMTFELKLGVREL